MASKIASLTAPCAAALLLLATPVASADDLGGDSIPVPAPSTEMAGYDSPADPEAGSLCVRALTYDPERPWRYDTEYIFPLTRNMSCSELPLTARIVMYPFAAIFDLFGLPAGAVAGLGGE